jgi:tetratricopeptide (TPR) repeat protein
LVLSVTDIRQLLIDAVALHQTGQAATAEGMYRRILAVDPQNPDALYLLGAVFFNCALPEEAIRSTRRAVTANPRHAQAHFNLGHILRNRKRLDEAVMHYDAAARLSPGFAATWEGLARTLIDLGRYAEAEDPLVRAVTNTPQSADLVFLLGGVREAQGKQEAARSAFRRALTFLPSAETAWLSKARVAMSLNRLAEARADLNRSLRLNPESVDALLESGRLTEALRVWDEAAADLGAAATRRPDDLALRLRLARAARNANRDDEALSAARAASQATDAGIASEALMLMATIARDRDGRLEEAVGYFEQAVARHPAQSLAHFHLGATRLLIGKSLDEAFPERGLASAHAELARRLAAEDRLKDACAHFHEALLFVPHFAPAREGLHAALALRQERCRYGALPNREHTVEWGNIALFHAMDKYNQAIVADPRLLGVPSPTPLSGSKPRVFDCFTFYNELDLLEARLEELWDEIDVFVVVEAPETFQGEPKPLILRENFERFRRFASKLVVVSIAQAHPGPSPWDREGAQRDAIMQGLSGRAAPQDVVFLGDIDEIPRKETVVAIRDNPRWASRLNRLSADYFCGFVDFKCNYRWHKQVALPYALLSQIDPDHTRFLAIAKYGTLLYDAGWHFSWLGGIGKVITKLKAYAHSEHTKIAQQDEATILRALRSGQGIFALMAEDNTYGGEFSVVPPDDRFPAVIARNTEKYKQLGWFYPHD